MQTPERRRGSPEPAAGATGLVDALVHETFLTTAVLSGVGARRDLSLDRGAFEVNAAAMPLREIARAWPLSESSSDRVVVTM